MSRLLFAAARGARLQFYDAPRNLPDQRWRVIHMIPQGVTNGWDYRIHPDDAHLQYGPISTALREWAKQPKMPHQNWSSPPPHLGFWVDAETKAEHTRIIESNELAHSLALLILAEALADEGL